MSKPAVTEPRRLWSEEDSEMEDKAAPHELEVPPNAEQLLFYLATHKLSTALTISMHCKMEESACTKMLQTLLTQGLVEKKTQSERTLWSATARGMAQAGLKKTEAKKAHAPRESKRGGGRSARTRGGKTNQTPRQNKNRHAQNIERVFAFLADNPYWSAEDLSDALKMPVSVVYRVLRTLRERGTVKSSPVWYVVEHDLDRDAPAEDTKTATSIEQKTKS